MLHFTKTKRPPQEAFFLAIRFGLSTRQNTKTVRLARRHRGVLRVAIGALHTTCISDFDMTENDPEKTTLKVPGSARDSTSAVWHFVFGLLLLATMVAMVILITAPMGFYLYTPGFSVDQVFTLLNKPITALLGYAWVGLLFLAFAALHITVATIATIYGFRLTMVLGRWASSPKKA